MDLKHQARCTAITIAIQVDNGNLHARPPPAVAAGNHRFSLADDKSVPTAKYIPPYLAYLARHDPEYLPLFHRACLPVLLDEAAHTAPPLPGSPPPTAPASRTRTQGKTPLLFTLAPSPVSSRIASISRLPPPPSHPPSRLRLSLPSLSTASFFVSASLHHAGLGRARPDITPKTLHIGPTQKTFRFKVDMPETPYSLPFLCRYVDDTLRVPNSALDIGSRLPPYAPTLDHCCRRHSAPAMAIAALVMSSTIVKFGHRFHKPPRKGATIDVPTNFMSYADFADVVL
ncbi:hypothetical protein CSAL01_02676 [Colletotrichum salicis]|uniref:Uncharacterized protein n=1 Tax=Colletotrichum salicis TaxID=1209931 RepID=A0A135SKB6_9PEZI|nr:hypothetical protein CSAL01_02676 [Colletotrichum salicis]